jgi:hypothetical protein
MSTRRASAAESHFIDAVARRVVELLESGRGSGTSAPRDERGECLTVAQVAERYCVSRSWVYAHQRELGAIRMGSGPKAHLRFDAYRIAKAIAAMAEQSPDDSANGDTRGRGRELRLIPFEPMDQPQRL